MTTAIQTCDLTKHFGNVVGVEGLNLDVPQGEVFGLIGSNGAGKTTTLRLLFDLIRPTRGRASVLGRDCHSQGVAARHLLSYAPAEMPIYPELTGEAFLRYLAGLDQRLAARSLMDRLFHRFAISRLNLTRPVRDMSHGMKRKLFLVQALARDAPVVVLDEPTAGLDPQTVDAFCETIVTLRREGPTTVLLSSHALGELERICDRVGVMRRGRLVSIRTPQEVRASEPRLVRVSFRIPTAGPASPLPGARVLQVEDREWLIQLHGPMGELLCAIADRPVADIQVEEAGLAAFVRRLHETEFD